VRRALLHRGGQLWPARGQARHDPRRRRQPAADAGHWQVQGHGAHPHGQVVQRRRGGAVGARRARVPDVRGPHGGDAQDGRDGGGVLARRRPGVQGGRQQEPGPRAAGRRRV
ncbi:hypothetical protein BN1708_017744, partial [Verticillium longisporum]